MARLTGSLRPSLLMLSVVGLGLLGAVGCSAPAETGLRGSGTVLRPRETEVATEAPAAAEATPARSPMAHPALAPTHTPEPEPIVPPEALPTMTSGSTDAEMHVLPVVAGRPPMSVAMPARRVIIPTIGLDSKVIQLGTRLDRRGEIAWETAPFAVGQHKGLAGPGQNGNMVLSGHISSPNEGAVFHKLPELKVGEGVVVATEERQYLYRVVETRTVLPNEVSVLDQTPDPIVTLITCVPDGIYSHRLVVTARLV